METDPSCYLMCYYLGGVVIGGRDYLCPSVRSFWIPGLTPKAAAVDHGPSGEIDVQVLRMSGVSAMLMHLASNPSPEKQSVDFCCVGFPSCIFQHLKIVHTYSVFFPGPLDSSCYFTWRRFSLCWHRGYRYDRCRIQAEVASKHRHQCWLASPFARPGQGCWRKMTYCKCKTNFRCPYAINLQRIP